MRNSREKFSDSAMTKCSFIEVLEGSECVPGTCPIYSPCDGDSNIKAVICLCYYINLVSEKFSS